jgi:hypothetical protein
MLPTSTSAATTTPAATDALCKLLTLEEAEKYGASPTGEPGNSISDGHPQCQWTGEHTSLLIGFQRGVQSRNARTGPDITNTPLTVHGRTAMRSRDLEPVELCQILVDLSPDSLVYASATNNDSGEGKYVPCDVAYELINLVVPRMPEK